MNDALRTEMTAYLTDKLEATIYNPDKAGGMDAALSALRDQPFGTVLLLAMAVGFAAFGVYCFVWARKARY